MPVRLPIDPAITNGDAFGVDDNYDAYEEDPLTGEWVPPGELAQRQADRAAKAAQPAPPPADADTPQTSPANPDISALPQDQADSMDKLSSATRNAYAPDASKDASLSEGELAAQGLTDTTGGGAPTAPAQTSGARPFTQAAVQAAQLQQSQSQSESQGEAEANQTGQTLPAGAAAAISPADTGQDWADPYNVGAIYNGPTGMRPPQNEREMALAKGDISSSSNLLENKVGQVASAAYNAGIPVVTPALEAVKSAATTAANVAAPVVSAAVNATPLGEASQIPQALGIGVPNAGQAASFATKQLPAQIPTHLGDLALTLAPFLGEGGKLIEGVSGAVRENLTKQALDAGYPDLETAVRDVIAHGETGAARLPGARSEGVGSFLARDHSQADLRSYAETNGIDVSAARTKQEVIDALQASREAPSATAAQGVAATPSVAPPEVAPAPVQPQIDPQTGEHIYYHGTAGPIAGDQLTANTFLTPNRQDAATFANATSRLTGKEPSVVEVRANPDALRPMDDVNSATATTGAVQISNPEGVRIVDTSTAALDTPAQQQLRDRVASAYYGQGAAQKQRVVDIVLGAPPWYSDALAHQEGSLAINPEAVARMLPGYAQAAGSDAVQAESHLVAAGVLDHATAAGDNIVLAFPGDDAAQLEQFGHAMKAKGYAVRLHDAGSPAFNSVKDKEWVSGSQRIGQQNAAASAGETGIEPPQRLPARTTEPAGQASEAGGPDAAGSANGGTGVAIPGLAESVANPDAVRAHAAAVRSGEFPAGAASRSAATGTGNGTGLVVRSDGTSVAATPASVEDAVQRVFARKSGLSLKANGGDVREQLIQGLMNARTLGGKSLLQGVDREVIEDALDNVMLDQNFHMSRSPGRGKFATTYQVGGETRLPGGESMTPGDTASRVEARRKASTQAPEATAVHATAPATASGSSAEPYMGQVDLHGHPVSGDSLPPNRLAEPNAKLPRDLAGAQPRYRESVPQFESDVDKAAYITAQTTPSKHDAQYVKFVMDATGLDEQGVRDLGNQVRSAVKDAVENADDPLHPQVSQVYGAQPAEAAATVKPQPTYNELVDSMGKSAADDVIKARAAGTGDTSLMEGGNGGEVPPGGGAPSGSGTPPGPQRFTHNVADKTYGFVGDLYNEFKGAIGAFPTLKTALHLPVLRQGYPYLILHPLDAMGITRDAIHAMASSPFAADLMQQAKDRVLISGDAAAKKAANFIGQTAQEAGLRISSYDVGATAEERESEMQGLNASRISRGVERIPGILQTARGYTVETNLTRMHWYETVANQMSKAGVKDPREYQALANTINHWTQYGTGKLAKQGEIPFLFSQRAAVGRIQAVTDFLTQPGSLFHASARQEAAKALVAFVGANAALIGIAVESGAGKAVYQNASGLHVPTLKFGQTTVNPWAGISGPVNLVLGLTQDAAKLARHQSADPLARVIEFIRSDLGPLPGKALDIASRTDYAGYPYNLKADLKSGQFAKDLVLPLFAESVWDAIKENGPKSWNNLAALPSLGGMSASSYPPTLTQMRDQAAAAMGKQGTMGVDGKPLTKFANALPTDQQTIGLDPKITQFTSQNQSAYQKASDAAHAPIQAEVQRNEDLFNQGQNTKKLSDVYHDEATSNQQAAHDLTDQFASTFAGFNKTAYTKAVDGYYNTVVNVPTGQANAGGYDPDATAAARADYLSKLPSDQQQWLNASLQVTEGNKTPLHQEYDKYIADKKAAGYFALDPKAPDYNAQKAALDKANPALDVASFKFNSVAGTGGGSLNSATAVDQALALNRPNTPVKATLDGVGSLSRPVNQTPEVQQAWEDSKAELAKYAAAKVSNRAAEQAHLAQGNSANAADYNKPWDKLTKTEQTTVDGGLATAIRDGSPKIDALLAWWGVTSTLRTQAALTEYRKLQATYGKDKASPTQNVTLIAGAP